MSASTKLTTLAPMEDATIYSASSEVTAHPSDELVRVEPNFYWESNQSSYQHVVIVDLGKPVQSNIVIVATRNTEAESGSLGVDVDVSCGNDGVTFDAVTNPVDPGIMEGEVIKPFRFDLTGERRYWKFVVMGYDSPDYYPPDPTRLAGIWVGREREISIPHAWPDEYLEIYPTETIELPFAMRFNIGRNLHPYARFSRQYLLLDSDYDDFVASLSAGGASHPFALQEGDEDTMLVRVDDKMIRVTIADGIYVVTATYTRLPLLAAGEAY